MPTARHGEMRLVLAVALLIATPASAAAEERTTMDAYVAEVVARNPSVHAGVLRRDAYRDEAVAAGKWPDPFVSVMVDRVPQAMGGEMPMIRYGVTQMLPWPGKLSLMRLAVDRQSDGAAAEVETRKLDLRLAAERGFVMLWMNAKRRELNRAQRALASTIASAALGRYGAGLGQHHDVARAQVEINTLDVEHVDLEGERTSIVAMLNALRNQPSDLAFADPVDIGRSAPTPLVLGPLVDKAMATRPELRRMRAMHDESEAMAAFSRREPYPDLMTGIWANQMIGGTATMGAMIGFTLPVFGGSRGSHRGAAYDARASSASEEAESMRAMIRAEVADALIKVQTAARQVDLVETIALPKAHESFDAALAGYGAGTLDIVGVLDSQRELQASERLLIEARGRRALAVADLEHAIGGPP